MIAITQNQGLPKLSAITIIHEEYTRPYSDKFRPNSNL